MKIIENEVKLDEINENENQIFECVIESKFKPMIIPNISNLNTNSKKKKIKKKNLDNLIHFSNITSKKNNINENVSIQNNSNNNEK